MMHNLRPFEQRALEPLTRRMRRFHPNTITWLSLAAGLIGGILLLLKGAYLLIAVAFIIASGVLDLMDGNLARRFNKKTKRGDYLDWIVDRYVDLFILLGIIYSGYVIHREVGYLAIIGIFLTSFIGSRAEFSGAKPVSGGILGRADRIFLITIAIIAQYALIALAHPTVLGLFAFDWLLIILAVLAHATALYRFISGFREIRKTEKT